MEWKDAHSSSNLCLCACACVCVCFYIYRERERGGGFTLHKAEEPLQDMELQERQEDEK